MRLQWLMVGAVASATAISFAVFFTDITFADIGFFFQNGQEIVVVGNMVGCIPTRGLDVCEPGFRDTRGNYFWLENLYEISEANPGLLTEVPSDDGAYGRFVVRGTFTAGDPPHSGVDVAGSIKVTSMTRTGDGAQIIVPD